MAKLTEQEFNDQMASLRLQREQLEVADLQDKLDERKMKKLNQASVFKTRGAALKDTLEKRAEGQAGCTHKKGGPGHLFTKGGGDDNKFSVIKHQMPNRDVLVMCTRCGQTWVPPVYPNRADYAGSKEFDLAVAVAQQQLDEYKKALAFPTDNQMSGGALFMLPEERNQECRASMNASRVTG